MVVEGALKKKKKKTLSINSIVNVYDASKSGKLVLRNHLSPVTFSSFSFHVSNVYLIPWRMFKVVKRPDFYWVLFNLLTTCSGRSSASQLSSSSPTFPNVNENKRMRQLLKVLALSDIVIYKTRLVQLPALS